MLVVLYASMVVALAIAAYGVWRLVRVWRIGRPAPVWNHLGLRTRRTLGAIAQATVLRKRVPGIAHALVFYGFWVLFAATVVVFLDHDLGLPIMEGAFYL